MTASGGPPQSMLYLVRNFLLQPVVIDCGRLVADPALKADLWKRHFDSKQYRDPAFLPPTVMSNPASHRLPFNLVNLTK